MDNSTYLNSVRRKFCYNFRFDRLTVAEKKDYFKHEDPIEYVRGKSGKIVGTIHYSMKNGFYWMVWNNSNCYLINPDGSLGTRIFK